jgi:hypothetical protein
MTVGIDLTVPLGEQLMLNYSPHGFRYRIDTWFITCNTIWFPTELSTYSTPRAMKL